MKSVTAIICLTIISGSLAGCLDNDDEPAILFSECTSFWHVEFFDLSNNNFNSWDGKVEFTNSDGDSEVLEGFSNNKKYVTLDESMTWELKYTFYEDDIGFIVGDTRYGGNNQNGESGTIKLDLSRNYADENDNEYPIAGSECSSGWHIKFVDQSNENFGSWEGSVEFTDSNGETYSMQDFSSEMKYITLEESQIWTMKYTFYEDDIGFIYNGKSYGLNNEYGDSGEITIDLT
tara:strand:+ start:14884 stop:15582 length:699 start_codon:yes stop_codon:yes gene_type:complete